MCREVSPLAPFSTPLEMNDAWVYLMNDARVYLMTTTLFVLVKLACVKKKICEILLRYCEHGSALRGKNTGLVLNAANEELLTGILNAMSL